MPEIREIKSNEYLFLKEMLYEAIFQPDPAKALPRSIVDDHALSKYVANFGRLGDFAVVLIDDNKLVGAAWARAFAKEEGSYGFIAEGIPELSIAIYRLHRNQGFGTQMIDSLIKILRANGIENASLSVDKRNPAVKLYLRLGFEIVSEERSAFTMLKVL